MCVIYGPKLPEATSLVEPGNGAVYGVAHGYTLGEAAYGGAHGGASVSRPTELGSKGHGTGGGKTATLGGDPAASAEDLPAGRSGREG